LAGIHIPGTPGEDLEASTQEAAEDIEAVAVAGSGLEMRAIKRKDSTRNNQRFEEV
jgi:hypothetical protein